MGNVVNKIAQQSDTITSALPSGYSADLSKAEVASKYLTTTFYFICNDKIFLRTGRQTIKLFEHIFLAYNYSNSFVPVPFRPKKAKYWKPLLLLLYVNYYISKYVGWN